MSNGFALMLLILAIGHTIHAVGVFQQYPKLNFASAVLSYFMAMAISIVMLSKAF